MFYTLAGISMVLFILIAFVSTWAPELMTWFPMEYRQSAMPILLLLMVVFALIGKWIETLKKG
jgi:Kef-type K+ transport system membrane component KefB